MNTAHSIIVPLYNESARLQAGFEAIRAWVDGREKPCEVVFVDDGSSDDTHDKISALIEGDERFRLISYPGNRGKGYAVKTGMLEATGEARLFTDIDLAVPIEQAGEFFDRIDSGAAVVIGTRKVAESRVVKYQPAHRRYLGEVFRRASQVAFAPGVSDFTCGFKAFNAEATERIFAASLIERWSFDAEILFLAHRWGYSIDEIPVQWTDSPATKVNLILDLARSTWELFLIRINWARGLYRRD
jgi:glycosyltransferase involved in cell wall biosynthesis